MEWWVQRGSGSKILPNVGFLISRPVGSNARLLRGLATGNDRTCWESGHAVRSRLTAGAEDRGAWSSVRIAARRTKISGPSVVQQVGFVQVAQYGITHGIS